MKCLIVGGGGFIGSFVADALLLAGYSVRIFEKVGVQPYRIFNPDERIEWFFGDLLDSRHIYSALDKVDVVLHLVSTTLPNGSNENIVNDVGSNVKISCSILDGMRLCNIRRIIFISSGGTVYGEPEYLPIDENHPTSPMVSYGVSKLMIEKYLWIYHKLFGFDVAILRVSNPYGDRQKTNAMQGVVSIFLRKVYSGEQITIWGDGSLIRDYIHVSDVASAFVAAVDHPFRFRVYNVGAGVGVSLIELIRLIERCTGRDANVNFMPGRQFDVSSNVLDISRIRSELGWTPFIELVDGIQRTCDKISASTSF